jgi:hypothetical protein
MRTFTLGAKAPKLASIHYLEYRIDSPMSLHKLELSNKLWWRNNSCSDSAATKWKHGSDNNDYYADKLTVIDTYGCTSASPPARPIMPESSSDFQNPLQSPRLPFQYSNQTFPPCLQCLKPLVLDPMDVKSIFWFLMHTNITNMQT